MKYLASDELQGRGSGTEGNRLAGKYIADFFKNNGIKCSTWDSFEPSNFDLVVNSTSAGLKDEYLPCPKELLESVLKNASFIDAFFIYIFVDNTSFARWLTKHALFFFLFRFGGSLALA